MLFVLFTLNRQDVRYGAHVELRGMSSIPCGAETVKAEQPMKGGMP
jgi:hypothetical protein